MAIVDTFGRPVKPRTADRRSGSDFATLKDVAAIAWTLEQMMEKVARLEDALGITDAPVPMPAPDDVAIAPTEGV